MTTSSALRGTAAPTAAETASTLKKLLKRSRRTAANERDDATRLDALRRTFALLHASGDLVLAGDVSSSAANDDDKSSSKTDVKSKWNDYLKARHDEYIDQLSLAVRSNRKSALRTFCGVIASSPISSSSQSGYKMINERLLYQLIDAVTKSSGDDGNMDEGLLNMLDTEFLSPHRDVQYFAMLSIKKIAGEIYRETTKPKSQKGKKKKDGESEDDMETTAGARAENLLRILLRIEIASNDAELDSSDAFLIAPPAGFMASPMENEEDSSDEDEDGEENGDSDADEDDEESEDSDDDNDNNSGSKRKRKGQAETSNNKRSRHSPTRPTWQQSSKHRRALQESWLAVLKIPFLPNRALKRALQHLPTAILPVVSAPLRFADVCTRAYEVGGVTSLLALHSLFVLMMDHGLEYPQFYASLYRLVTPRNFYAKHRTRFFRLLNSCLAKSDMLPAYVVAAFCKRLARCALTAPPSGSLFVLALISNLLRRHGECGCLVHRGTGRGDDAALEDLFDADATDPAQSRALESSLWELAALEKHCHPAVAALAKSIGTEDDKTPMHDMDEFLLHTYRSLFETERKRIGDPKSKKKRKAVPLTFEKPKSLFTEGDVFAGILCVPSPAVGDADDEDR